METGQTVTVTDQLHGSLDYYESSTTVLANTLFPSPENTHTHTHRCAHAT